jgi:hypothetical protein
MIKSLFGPVRSCFWIYYLFYLIVTHENLERTYTPGPDTGDDFAIVRRLPIAESLRPT